jgi:hypothetical protein
MKNRLGHDRSGQLPRLPIDVPGPAFTAAILRLGNESKIRIHFSKGLKTPDVPYIGEKGQGGQRSYPFDRHQQFHLILKRLSGQDDFPAQEFFLLLQLP